MRQILIVAALVILNCSFTPAQTTPEKANENGETEQVILQLESEGRKATLENDIKANDRLLADNWLNINPDGSITTKAKLLELLKDGSFKIMSIENDEITVRVYGERRDAAVVTGRSTTKRAGQGGEVLVRQVRFTRVYAKSNGQWRVVSAHNTLIAKP
jgi:ketosteroid isomerase-like protein